MRLEKLQQKCDEHQKHVQRTDLAVFNITKLLASIVRKNKTNMTLKTPKYRPSLARTSSINKAAARRLRRANRRAFRMAQQAKRRRSRRKNRGHASH